MMKNFYLISSLDTGIKKKWRRFIRLTFFMMIGFILSVSANSYSQSTEQWLNPDRAQQERTVTGVVSDQDGQPLPGVSIIIKGTTQGTVTDVNGEFTLSIPGDADALQFSFVGMKTQEIPIAGRTTFTVVMEEETIGLEEVVAVGYGVQKKVNLTGSVSNVKIEELERKNVTQASQLLAGEISGVSVNQSTGNPGKDAAAIRIRGMGTFSSAGNSPLILVDGFPASINSVNPNNIESISVLKDAASASIYGSRAANGVILITTKKGKEGELRVAYDSYVGKQEASEIPQFVDSWIYAEAVNESRVNMGQSIAYSDSEIEKFKSGEDPDAYPNKYHLKDLLTSGNGLTTRHNLTFSGGSNNTKFLFSTGYLRQNGLIEQNYYNRYDVHLNLIQKMSDKFLLDVKISGFRSQSEEPVTYDLLPVYEIINGALRLNNSIPGKRSDGSYGYLEQHSPEAFIDSKSFSNDLNNNLMGNVSLEWDIINSLKLTGKVNYSLNDAQEKQFSPEIEINPDLIRGPSRLNMRNSKNTDLTIESILNYDKRIDNHHFAALGGFSMESFNNNWIEAFRDNFPSDLLYELNVGSEGNMKNSGSAYSWKLLSYFGRINYSFKGKYLFEVNARYDGSSRFAEGNKFGFFPSISGGWRISEEDFFQSALPWITNFKIRSSIGRLGNQQIGTYPYQKTINLGFNYPIGGALASGGALTTLPFEEITWETTTITNLGFDIALLDNKLHFATDYFYKKTEDILYTISVAQVLGLTASEQNAGAIENKGWEFELSYNNSIGDFSYSIRPNFSLISNQVLSLANVEQDIGKGLFVGEPLNVIYGYEADGLFIDQADIDSYAKQHYNAKPGLIRYKDISGPDGVPDGKVSPAYDRKVIGSTIPKYLYGAGITAGYKSLDFYMQLQGLGGHYKMPQRWQYAFYNGSNIQEWQWEGRWTEENPDRNAAYPRLEATGSGSPVFGQNSTYWLLNAGFLRIKNIQLGYTIPENLIRGIEKFRIYLSGTNLITFDHFQEGWDPEMDMMYGGSGHYPLVKVITCGLNINF
jgi:TonB-dependent starch-binding outer membrane protein SusC